MKDYLKAVYKKTLAFILRPAYNSLEESLRANVNRINQELFTEPYFIESNLSKNHKYTAFSFANTFRGSEDLIQKRQLFYLKVFKGKNHIVDIGCGRGEFLQILAKKKIACVGVDSDSEMVKYCKENGLKVYKSDFLKYLQKSKNASFEGIFSAQVIEHIELEKLLGLIDTAHKKLKKNGLLVLETLNPYCFPAMKYFHMDPTHTRPYFPETVQYFMYSKGFKKVRIKYLNPVNPQTVKETSVGSSRFKYADYAIIATK